MILFINGFVPMDWFKHEVGVRNKSCYGVAGSIARINPGAGAGVAAQCLGRSFEENKQGNVYSPVRDSTYGAPYYKGQAFDYWSTVKGQLSKGFGDNRLFFINGSSDNRTTGKQRYALGVQLGGQMIKTWEHAEKQYQQTLQQIKNEMQRVGSYSTQTQQFTFLPQAAKNGMQQYYQYSLNQLNINLSRHDPEFFLQQGETLKIVGHSMGAAISAGVASVITKHPVYGKRLEVVLYLAPHQPQDFTHPAGVIGYQSSSAEDLVASKNTFDVPVAVIPVIRMQYNPLLLPIIKSVGTYTVTIPVSTSWSKGVTAYQKIANITADHFIENTTYAGDAMRGHGVGTYTDEVDRFFSLYRSRHPAHR